MEGRKNVKVLFVIIDGVGDCLIEELGSKTPFQHVSTPTLDRLAKYGANGLLDSFAAGKACGSDTAHLSLFSYNPVQHYQGRGAFETEGSGLLMAAGDIAFKCNFAYMDPHSKVVELRRVDRNFDKWGLELVALVNGIVIPGFEGYQVTAKHATEHRIGLKISGPHLSNQITDTDPLVDGKPLLTPLPLTPEADLTARLVLSSHEVQGALRRDVPRP